MIQTVKKAVLATTLALSSMYAFAEDYAVAIEPMTTTQWGQSSPYNQGTPLLQGQQTYPGCAAIAVAQILKFHEYPSVGRGEVNYWWDLGGKELSVDFSSYQIDFGNMPDSLYRASREQRENLTDFIYRIGVGLNAEFGIKEGTEASGKLIENLFRYHLNYGKSRRSMKTVTKQAGDWVMYDDEEWLLLVKKELNEGRPVLYMAQSQDGTGHVFVIDGYNQEDKVHVNWGWAGKYNGYYNLGEMNPDPNYPDEKWIENPTMFIGLEPKEVLSKPKKDRQSGSVAEGEWLFYGPYVNQSGELKVVMQGDGDADLYVQRGSQPDEDNHQCRPYEKGSEETCHLSGKGDYYIGVHGYAEKSNFKLSISYQ